MKRKNSFFRLFAILLFISILLSACSMHEDSKTPADSDLQKQKITTSAEEQTEEQTDEQTEEQTDEPLTPLDLHFREKEILEGLIFPLNEGLPLEAPLDFSINLTPDDKNSPDSISIREGRYSDGSMGWELFLNGNEMGYSSLWESVNQRKQSAKTSEERSQAARIARSYSFMDEANFSKADNCRLYLISLDGKSICLAISGDKETFITNGYFVRMRGQGKSINDLTPRSSLEKYISDGWEVRPSDGDMLDFDGNGIAETLHVSYMEEPVRRAEIISFSSDNADSTHFFYAPENPDASVLAYRYDRLYYIRNNEGGYDLKGEVLSEGAQYQTVWKVLSLPGSESLQFQEQ